MSQVATLPQQNSQPPSLLSKMAAKYSVDPSKMLTTLKATAFKGDVSNEQMMALLIVADQYGLNPWTKEIYAFPDRQNGIVSATKHIGAFADQLSATASPSSNLAGSKRHACSVTP